MKVYVIEAGDYEQSMIVGVYSTLELAQARYPNAKWYRLPYWEYWGSDDTEATITEYTVDPTE